MARMKRFMPYIVIALVAMTVVLYQPLAVFGRDDFAMTPDGYKVFRYGFPFPIVDCAAHLLIHMTVWQVGLRFVANFAVFFFPGAFIVHLIRRILTPQVHREVV